MKDETRILEKFINRFAFNADADLEYFFHGLSGEDKTYIEHLKINVIKLIKSNKAAKKCFATYKVRTDRNEKKLKESFEQLRTDYLRTVELFKDSHHFLITLLKLDILAQNGNEPGDIIELFNDMNSNFSELLQQINFTKEEKYHLNLFNRMRNIIIHAPSGIIMEYLTDNVLEEFKNTIDSLFYVVSILLARNIEQIKSVRDFRQEKLREKELAGVEEAKTFAKKHELTINELLDIMKNTKYDYTSEIHPDMILDLFTKEAIIDKVKAKQRQKRLKLEREENREILEFVCKTKSTLIINFEKLFKTFNNSQIDRVVNHVYDAYNTLNINHILIFSEQDDKEIIKAIKEIYYITGRKESNIYSNSEILNTLNELSHESIILLFCPQESFVENISNKTYIIRDDNPFKVNLLSNS